MTNPRGTASGCPSTNLEVLQLRPTKSDRKNLIAHIEAAFPTQPIPAHLKLTKGDSEEAFSYDCIFGGRTWSSLLDAEFLWQNRAAMTFFVPDAFRYYIPAFMTISIRETRASDLVPAEVISAFTLPSDSGAAAQAMKLYRAFTKSQAAVIRDYLEFFAAWHEEGLDREARKALRQFWAKG